MPMNRALYPTSWEQIAHLIKSLNNWECAHCGKICRQSGESLVDFAIRIEGKNNEWLDWYNQTAIADLFAHPQKFTLTVAHLNHRPDDCRIENLRPLCAPCHLRYDAKDKALKRRLKREREGQLTLEVRR